MDIRFENHGSIMLIRPKTDAGTEWCDEHLPDDAQMFGNANATVCEPRYVGDIINGMQSDGLEVEGGAM
jgi:hypothetical protein